MWLNILMDDFHMFEQHCKNEGNKTLYLIILGKIKKIDSSKKEYKFYIWK